MAAVEAAEKDGKQGKKQKGEAESGKTESKEEKKPLTGVAIASAFTTVYTASNDLAKPIGGKVEPILIVSILVLAVALPIYLKTKGKASRFCWHVAAITAAVSGLMYSGQFSSATAQDRGIIAASAPPIAAAQAHLPGLSESQRRLLIIQDGLDSSSSSQQQLAANSVINSPDQSLKDQGLLLMYRSKDRDLRLLALQATLRMKVGGSIHFRVHETRPSSLGSALSGVDIAITGVRPNGKDFDGYVAGTNDHVTGQVSLDGFTTTLPLTIDGKRVNVTIDAGAADDGQLQGEARAANGMVAPVAIPFV